MTETMYTYIKKQSEILPELIENRAKHTDSFLKIFEQTNFKKIIIVASGSSYNAATSARYFMEKLLNIEVQVQAPYPFTFYENKIENQALVIAISQSGKSNLTIESVKKAQNIGLHTAVMTANPKSPLYSLSEYPILIPCGHEKVGFVTMGYSSTILTLQLMALELSYKENIINKEVYDSYIQNLYYMTSNIDNIIKEADNWYERNKYSFLKAERMMVVGYGPNFGTALEAGLKISETVRIPSNGYELEEFMHGPHLELNKDTYVFCVVSKGIGEKRIAQLQEFLDTVTPYNYGVSYNASEENPCDIPISSANFEIISPIEFVIPFQVLSYRLSIDKGIDLSKSLFPNFNSYVHSKAL